MKDITTLEQKRAYFKNELGAFACLNKNRLLEAALNSNGILVDEPLRQEMITKMTDLMLNAGLVVTRLYYKYKYQILAKKIGELSNYSDLYSSKEFIWIQEIGENIHGKTIIDFLDRYCYDESCKYSCNLDKLRQLCNSEDTYNKIVELMDKWEQWYGLGRISDVRTKRKYAQDLVIEIFAEETNYKSVIEFNSKFLDKAKKIILLYNLYLINSTFYEKFSAESYDLAVEKFKESYPNEYANLVDISEVDKLATSFNLKDKVWALVEASKWKRWGQAQNDEAKEGVIKDTDKVKKIIDDKLDNFSDIINLRFFYNEWHKFDDIEDYDILDPIGNKKYSYDNSMIDREEVRALINGMNFNAPATKNDLASTYTDRFLDLYKKCLTWYSIATVHEERGEEVDEYYELDYVRGIIDGTKEVPDYANMESDLSSGKLDPLEAEICRTFLGLYGAEYAHPQYFAFAMAQYNKDNPLTRLLVSSADESTDLIEVSKYTFCIMLYNSIFKQLSGYIQGQLERDLWYVASIEKDGSAIKSEVKSGPGLENYRLYCPVWNCNGVSTKRWSAGIHTWRQKTDVFRLLECEKDNIALYFDISQAEVRFAAYYSGDPDMMEMYDKGIDIYIKMSEMAYPQNHDPAFHKQNRVYFKSVVLGVLYGRGARSVAEATGITVEEAKRLIKTFKGMFPVLNEFIEGCKQYCCDNGCINTAFGDRLICDPDRGMTAGINWVIQESASIILAEGFFNLYAEGYKCGRFIHPKIVVHDSHTFTVHASQFLQVLDDIDKNFRQYLLDRYGIPFKYDLLSMTNLRDKVEFSYNKENGEITLKGDDYSIDSWMKTVSKFHDFEILEDNVSSEPRINPIQQFGKIGVSKVFTYYPDHNFIMPQYRKMKAIIRKKEC